MAEDNRKSTDKTTVEQKTEITDNIERTEQKDKSNELIQSNKYLDRLIYPPPEIRSRLDSSRMTQLELQKKLTFAWSGKNQVDHCPISMGLKIVI
ncbi:hypothetical protein MJO29_006952 [Puccinia striiformis f. sp. tritici]|nr:hypothetical protein MJO29_006952 [Puccinia striiformis f. sp. tritici]